MASEYTDSRRVGAATVTNISDGTARWAPRFNAPEAEWRRAMPEADAAGKLPLDCLVCHVALGDASVLIDLGFDDPSPTSTWQGIELQRRPSVEAGLASIGVRPEDVTHVIVTHAHGDHIAGGIVERGGERVARFPRAQHLIGRADSPASAPPGSYEATHLGGLERLGLLELVDGDREVVPGITMIHAPGETPGHSIVRIDSAGQTFFSLGDLFHHPCEVDHVDWIPPGRNLDTTIASRERLIREALAADPLMAFAHGRFPGWGRIVRANGGVRWVWA